MTRRPPECGTDGGYYHHLRMTKTKPCDACRAAHAARARELKTRAFGNCPCGTKLRTDHEYCSRCRKKLDRAEARAVKDGNEYDPKRPVAWVPKRGILRPVYEESEVA